jgi:hypothetical protein
MNIKIMIEPTRNVTYEPITRLASQLMCPIISSERMSIIKG